MDELFQAELGHDIAADSAVTDGAPQPSPLRACRLLRGPQLAMLSYEELGCPKTIVNLRASEDDLAETRDSTSDGPWSEEVRHSLRMVHCGAENDLEKYNTRNPDVRKWLVRFVKIFEGPLEWPVLVHCRAGRDRTGVAIAMLLLLLDVPEDIIIADFMLSQGTAQRLQDFKVALAGVARAGGARTYFGKDVDVDAVLENLRGDLGDEEEAALVRRECGRLFRFAFAQRSRCGMELRARHCCMRVVQMEQRVSRLSPSREPGLLAASGWALVALGRHEEARAVLREGLSLAEAFEGEPGQASAGARKMMRAELRRLEAFADASFTT